MESLVLEPLMIERRTLKQPSTEQLATARLATARLATARCATARRATAPLRSADCFRSRVRKSSSADRIVWVGLILVCGMFVQARPPAAWAQSVCLPAPRLLTTMPMGGRAGSQVEIEITGEHLLDAESLVFSDRRLSASPKLDKESKPVANRYIVTIAADCPPGLYEARIMTRLGISSPRAFAVGTLPETTRTSSNTTLATAFPLEVNSICNAVCSARAIDHYRFAAKQGQRLIVDCATRGIDSKLDATVVIADDAGRDLLVERRGGALDFTAPRDGGYVIKVHELTYKGGPAFFYRLGLWELAPGAPVVRQAGTESVNAFSWPPTGLPPAAAMSEMEPNDGVAGANDAARVQRIALPCDIAGSFFPAADVDVFEFEGKKGETWWIEVASERLGRPTDPAALVQRVSSGPQGEQLVDVLELTDIPSPVRVSSNGYAYDGPPYNAGSSDFLGRLQIPEDGRYRLRLADLFGGTRSDPANVYRLVIRPAAPDFALVAWALHMELRNGDRNALSKPLSLRGGATMALEVVALRRDGFDGEISLEMDELPPGVSARGLKMAAGQSRGILLLTAAADAPRSFANARFTGRAIVNGQETVRPCRLASMAWPIPDSWGEIPRPRLLADVAVSTGGLEQAPLSIAPLNGGPIDASGTGKLSIPLKLIRRSDFSGSTMQLRPMGCGFDRVAPLNVTITDEKSEALLDLAALKLPPGDHWLAFYGGAVAKYRVPKTDSTAAPPTDIVDIVVTEPIHLRVTPGATR
jgi:hypothetical protein